MTATSAVEPSEPRIAPASSAGAFACRCAGIPAEVGEVLDRRLAAAARALRCAQWSGEGDGSQHERGEGSGSLVDVTRPSSPAKRLLELR